MRHFLLLGVCIISCFGITFGQKKEKQNPIETAYALRKKGLFQEALTVHRNIFKGNPKNKLNNYNYACLYGIMHKKDSCLKYLDLALSTWLGLTPLSDPDLYFLHADPIWDSIETKVLELNAQRIAGIKDPDYAKKLFRLCAADQALYSELEIAQFKHGHDSKEVQDIWQKKKSINQKNQGELEQLLQDKGWPKRSEVGMLAANSAFLIIQHSNLEKMKQYIPTLKKLCNEGEGSCQAFAMMYDRIECSENRPQRYGTQIRYNKGSNEYELFPLENEGLLHEYREWAGLPLIEDYVAHWDIKLNIKKVYRNFAYADSLIKATLSKESKYPYFHGAQINAPIKKMNTTGTPLSSIVQVDPHCILDAEEDFCLTMPKGTEVTIMFTDNQVVNYPDQADLYIKEEGGANDKAVIYVSYDGKKFDSLGITFDGRASSLDLESIQYDKPVKFVKVISLDNNGGWPGYDLVYIKGLPGSNVDAKMTKEEINAYLNSAQKEVDRILKYEALRKQKSLNTPFVLKHVHFNSRSHTILKKSYPYLDRLTEELGKMNWKKIILTGHTDNQGNPSSNLILSKERAQAIRSYLWEKGLDKSKIICKGMGAKQPVRSNKTSSGRTKNRRVEIKIIQ